MNEELEELAKTPGWLFVTANRNWGASVAMIEDGQFEVKYASFGDDVNSVKVFDTVGEAIAWTEDELDKQPDLNGPPFRFT